MGKIKPLSGWWPAIGKPMVDPSTYITLSPRVFEFQLLGFLPQDPFLVVEKKPPWSCEVSVANAWRVETLRKGVLAPRFWRVLGMDCFGGSFATVFWLNAFFYVWASKRFKIPFFGVSRLPFGLLTLCPSQTLSPVLFPISVPPKIFELILIQFLVVWIDLGLKNLGTPILLGSNVQTPHRRPQKLADLLVHQHVWQLSGRLMSFRKACQFGVRASLKSSRLSVIFSDVWGVSEYDFNRVFEASLPSSVRQPADYPTRLTEIGMAPESLSPPVLTTSPALVQLVLKTLGSRWWFSTNTGKLMIFPQSWTHTININQHQSTSISPKKNLVSHPLKNKKWCTQNWQKRASNKFHTHPESIHPRHGTLSAFKQQVFPSKIRWYVNSKIRWKNNS